MANLTINENSTEGSEGFSVSFTEHIDYIIDQANKNNIDIDLFIVNGGIWDVLFKATENVAFLKEIGQVVASGEDLSTAADTVITDLEKAIVKIQEAFPNTKILYVQTLKMEPATYTNIVYSTYKNYGSSMHLPLNTWKHYLSSKGHDMSNVDDFEDIKDLMIAALTEGDEANDVPTAIPNFTSTYNSFIEEVKKVVTKYNMEYLDLSNYIDINSDVIQDQLMIFNQTGYEKLTPYIVNKAVEILN